MDCQTNQGPIQRILIECPPELKTDYGARDRDFEVFNGVHCFKLLVNGEMYTRVATFTNGESGYTRVLRTPQYSLRAYEPAIDFKIPDEYDFLYYIVEDIETRTIANRSSKVNIKLFDFVLPESEDIKLGRLNGHPAFTLRVGTLSPPVAQGGRVIGSSGQGWIKGGFTFRFTEKELRLR